MGPQIRDLVKAQRIAWTSIDVVRFITDGDEDKKIRGPVVIWVGFRLDSLEGEDAYHSSKEILHLLESYGIVDVDVEYRESIYRRSVGPALRPVSGLNHTVDVRGPLTPALGLPMLPRTDPTPREP